MKIAGVAHVRTREMTADEVITRLKDRMAQHSQEFRHAFLAFDRRNKGLVSKKDLRQVSPQNTSTLLHMQVIFMSCCLNCVVGGYIEITSVCLSLPRNISCTPYYIQSFLHVGLSHSTIQKLQFLLHMYNMVMYFMAV